jgi:transcriptional regulator with XRE-family HTH domain
MVDRERLGAVLRARRIQAGLTQEQLAERSGLSVRAIGDMERGKVARPHRESVRLLAEALGLSGDDHEGLMRLAGHSSPTPCAGTVGGTADPTPPRSDGTTAPRVDQPAIDAPAGERQEPVRADALPASPPAAPPRVRGRRGTAVATAAAAALCTAAAVVALWPAPVGEIPARPSEAPVAVVPSERSGYVGRIAADAQIVSSAGTDLRVDRPVTSGEALVVALMLTSTGAGAIAVTDTAGNRYTMVADVTDPYRHRVALFAAFKVSPLRGGDRLAITWPRASKHHIAVDEFHGLSAAKGQAAGTGAYDDHSSQGIAVGIAAGCAPGDLVLGAIGSNSGPAPALTPGWQRLPELQLSSYRLTVAFRRATAREHCVLTGTSRAQWGAALVSLQAEEPSR